MDELEELLIIYPDATPIVRPRWWPEAQAYLCERYDGEECDASIMVHKYFPTGVYHERLPIYLGFKEEKVVRDE